MAHIEIERKFLVKADFKAYAYKQIRITQGYIVTNSNGRSVRIRIKGDQGYITIKGGGSKSGVSRFEWEKQITVEEAQDLLKLCNPGIIDKIRYLIQSGEHTYEVDEFLGNNLGLYIAEIELTSENETFDKPHWLGQEVTNDERYYNAYLSQHPFNQWSTQK